MPARTEIRSDLHTSAELKGMARNEKVPRKARRLLAIAHAMDGMTFTAAAEAVGMERQALGDAVKRYNEEGHDGLNDRPKPGRTRKLTEKQENELKTIIENGPDPEIDGLSAYTLGDLAGIVKSKFGVTYNINYMGQLLRRLKFSRQKPRPFHPKKDEAAQAAFRGALGATQTDCRYTQRKTHNALVSGRSPHWSEGTGHTSLVVARQTLAGQM